MNTEALAAVSRLEAAHAEFARITDEILATCRETTARADANCKALSAITAEALTAVDNLERYLKGDPAAVMLSIRPRDSHIVANMACATDLAKFADELDVLLRAKGFDPLTRDQRVAMWAEYPEDTFNMILNTFADRLGIYGAEVDRICNGVFDLLDEPAQEQLRELELWGVL